MINAEELLTKYSPEELISSANEYFASQIDNEYFLNKPFGSVDETPTLLAHFVGAISFLNLFSGCEILDFGAGTGWTSRILAQMKCRVISSDVSDAALEISHRALIRAGSSIPDDYLSFLKFNGQSFDLPDQSMDRILCIDAFHHVANQSVVIGEFARILKPGGVLVFSEPGPNHSQTPQAQAEMRNYAVVERDFVPESIAKIAKNAGFDEGDTGIYSPIPQPVPITSIEEHLSSSLTFLADGAKGFHQNHRLLRLRMPGEERADSRRRSGLGASIVILSNDSSGIVLLVTNTGTVDWLPSGNEVGSVNLGLHHLDDSENVLAFGYARCEISQMTLLQNDSINVHIPRHLLAKENGLVKIDLVAEHVTWLSWDGFDGPQIPVH
jgi:2-polyprenyl-3-methyl-5-hydroxy-6-metoxy-1,4-benzoquinol methylase